MVRNRKKKALGKNIKRAKQIYLVEIVIKTNFKELTYRFKTEDSKNSERSRSS